MEENKVNQVWHRKQSFKLNRSKNNASDKQIRTHMSTEVCTIKLSFNCKQNPRPTYRIVYQQHQLLCTNRNMDKRVWHTNTKKDVSQGIWLHLDSKIRQSKRWISSSIQKKDLNVIICKLGKTNTMEYLAVTLKGDSHKGSHNINVIYRPPDTNVLSFITNLIDL